MHHGEIIKRLYFFLTMGYYRNNLMCSYRPDGIGSTAVYTETYQYNDANQRTLRNRSVGGNVGYTYDYQSGQLETETPIGGTAKNYDVMPTLDRVNCDNIQLPDSFLTVPRVATTISWPYVRPVECEHY